MGSRTDSESYVPPGTYGMAGPMMHLCYNERGEDIFNGYSDHEKEMLKRVVLEHEVEFKGQVHELHRLWRVQRDLMLEYERNPLHRNSSSSQIPTNQHSTNETGFVFDSNQNRPNFEFVREGSAQSTANIVPAKKPMFDLQLPASEYSEHETGLKSRFGIGTSTISSFGKGIAVSSANMAGTSRNGRNLISDLNEPVKDTTDFDFLGVNRDAVWHRRSDEGSSSGLWCTNRNIANEGLALEKEKGRNSSGAHFFNADRNYPNLSSNSVGANFFSTYGSHQNPVKDQHAIAPQLFGQKLTSSFDLHQAHSTNVFSSNNSNNNLVGPISFPVLDSSPHCNNLHKNKGLMEGSIHPLSPFFCNGSGAAIGGSGDNSGFFPNVHCNLVFGSSGGQSLDFAKPNWMKSFTSGMNMDLNEPVPEGNQDTKVIKLFGSTYGGPVSEANLQKNEINLNNIANEDELSQKDSSSASVIAGERNSSSMKLFGIPFFGNSSSNSKSTLHADELNKSKKKVDPEHAGPAKLAFIDLNEDLPLENDPSPSKERNEGQIARYVIDLEMPASQFDEPSIDSQQHEMEMERASGPDLSVVEAANTIVAISQLDINPGPSSPQSDTLLQFADLVVSGCDNEGSAPESDSEDLFESMTLKLEEVKSDDRFGTGNFCKKKIEGESSSQAGDMGYTSLLFTRGRRGPARKRRQKRDFQRDVLPTIASLSRVEVTEDLQMIGGLIRACGQEFESALTRRAGRGGSNTKGKRQQRSPQVDPPVRTPQVKQPDRQLPQTSSPQGKLPEENLPLRAPPQANDVQNPHVNSPQRIPKASHPQKTPPVVMNQHPRVPLVNQTHGGILMGLPQKVFLEYQQPRNTQPNQPKKMTLVNQAHRYTFFNQRQKAPNNSSQNMPPIHQLRGVTEVAHSDVIVGNNWVQKSVQTNQLQRTVSASQSHTSVQASELQRIPGANPQQAVNQNSDMEGDNLSVIGWGRTTARRNRRPRGLPLASQQQQSGNNNSAVPLK